MDENTPHLHVMYIPVVEEQNKAGDRVKKINCSKFWKGYNSYGQLQEEFHKHITSRGYELERGEIGTGREHLETAELKKQTILKEIQKLEQNKKTADKQLQNFSMKVRGMKGVVLSQKKLEHIRPEPELMGAIKNVRLEDIENLKKTATEFYIVNEKLKDLSTKYVNLKSKVPTMQDKKELAIQLHKLEQLEKENEALQKMLHDAGIGIDRELQKGKSKEQGIE